MYLRANEKLPLPLSPSRRGWRQPQGLRSRRFPVDFLGGVGDQGQHRRPGGDILAELLGIDLVERVVGRVVIVEIAGSVLLEIDRRDSGPDPGAEVRASGRGIRGARDSERREN